MSSPDPYFVHRLPEALGWTTPEVEMGGSPIPSEEAEDEAIHTAARTDDQEALQSAVDVALRNGVDIDGRDSRRLTALEIAIQANSSGNVRVLINSGAAVNRIDSAGEQPLHFAIRSSTHWSIIRLLLEEGAKTSTPALFGNRRVSVLRYAVQCQNPTGPLQLQNYLQTIYQLVKHGANFDSTTVEGLAIYDRILTRISRIPFWLDDTLPKVRDTLKLFLGRLECDPFHDTPIAFCPAASCKTLAASILFHTPNTALSAILTDSRLITRSGEDLLYLLLNPCPYACLSRRDQSFDGVIRQLLTSRNYLDNVCIRLGTDRNPICHVFARTPTEFKKPFAQALASSGAISVSASDVRYGRALARLVEVDRPLRYELAEIFLRSELDLWWPSRLQPPTSPSLLIFHPWQDYATYFTPEYEKHVKLHLTSASPDNTVLNAALDCIYHVLTRHMIEHALFGDMDYAKRIRLLDGLKIRQDRGLPPLTFDNAAAYNLCMTGRVGYSAREPGGNGRGRNLRSSS